MPEPKWTPGPWTVVDRPDSDYIDIATESGLDACRIERGSWRDKANARLIAAAPDLYAALEAAIPLLIRLGDFIGNKESRCEAILAARHALAKADGRDA